MTGEIDMTERVPYKQMYAQAVKELKDPDCLYWFTTEDEQEIREHNNAYLDVSSTESLQAGIFEPTEVRKKEYLWRATDIQNELKNRLKNTDVPTLKNIKQDAKTLRWHKGASNGIHGLYLKLRK